MINSAINSWQAYGHLWPTQCQEIQALHLTGVHLGPAGSKMMRNVLAQNRSLIEIKLAPWWHQGMPLDDSHMCLKMGSREVATWCTHTQ